MQKILTRNTTDNLIESMINSEDRIGGLQELAGKFLNALMLKEREISLRETQGNKANGFYERDLVSAMGNLPLEVPRDRNGDFRSFFLPKAWKRSEASYEILLQSLILNAYSPNKIKAMLKEMGLPYSPSEIEELKNEIYEKAKAFKTRQLPENTMALLIDAYHTDVKDDHGQVKKAVIYTILSLGLDGKKEIFGYYEMFGSENKGDWLSIFNDLIKRGFKRCLMVVSDDFQGLSAAIKTLFPKADHQLCFVHLQRNIKRNMGKEDFKVMKNELNAIIRSSSDFDSAINKFTTLCKKLEKRYPSFISYILENKEKYFQFLKYPEDVRKFIYTTNAVENINSRLEVLRYNNGGYFQSMKTLIISTFILIENIAKNKWKKVMNLVKANEYEINQMFNSRYCF